LTRSSRQVKPTGNPELDRDRLDELRQLAGPNFQTIVDSFEDDVRKLLLQLQQAVAEDNIKGIRDATHGLRGISANLAATGLSRLCEALEMRVSDSRNENLSGQLEGIENEYRCVLEKLRGWQQG